MHPHSTTTRDLIDWLNAEGIVELANDFPDSGDLFAAGLDSMAIMQLAVAAEERFGVLIGISDLNQESLGTPVLLLNLIDRKQSDE